MLIPKIENSTIENVTNEFFRAELPFVYLAEKLEQLKNHNPLLLIALNDLTKQIFVEHDDSDEATKTVNQVAAISIALVVINCINTQMEIDWLKA